MAQHTNGPWSLIYDQENNCWEVNADAVLLLGEVYDDREGDEEYLQLGEQRLGNAKLVSAAPELLECAKWALSEL